MVSCKDCTNYYLNGDNRVSDSCMGVKDCRSEYFECNNYYGKSLKQIIAEKESVKANDHK